MYVLIVFVMLLGIAYGGVFLMYFITAATLEFSGIGMDTLYDKYFVESLWWELMLWMIILSIILLVRRYKNVKKVYQHGGPLEEGAGQRMPRFWVGKKLLLCIICLMASPFLWLLNQWLISFEKNSFLELISMDLTLVSLLLPPAALYFAIFRD